MLCLHKWKIFEVIAWCDIGQLIIDKVGGELVHPAYDTIPQDIFARAVCLKCEKIKDGMTEAIKTYEIAYRKEQSEQLKMRSILKAKGGL